MRASIVAGATETCAAGPCARGVRGEAAAIERLRPDVATLFASEDAAGHQPGYLQLDARLTLETGDGRWALDVIGKNLTDRQILTYSTIQPTSPGSYLVSQAQGSNVVAQIRFHW